MKYLTLLLLPLLGTFSCSQPPTEQSNDAVPTTNLMETEKAAILKTLNGETQAAFSRAYEKWKEHWVHEPYVTKTYMNFADTTMSETRGWDQVNAFVRDYIAAHPEPAPLPEPLRDIALRLYGSGAWVSYEQQDPSIGLKREIRLMEKIDGRWKIAGMQTIIYGQKGE